MHELESKTEHEVNLNQSKIAVIESWDMQELLPKSLLNVSWLV